MCGIVGMLGAPDREVLERMNDSIRHRGPDDQGTFLEGPVALGARRLSIIDVAGGHQPMANEDGSVHVVYNGEIYNHVELREDLQRRGHRFETRCDTEVLAHLYEERGQDLVQDLLGMYAFAVWDSRRQVLLLARDRIGVKPLYYAWTAQGGLAFASELRALREHPGVDLSLNERAVSLYLSFGYVPPPDTIHRGIRALLPGHRIRARLGEEPVPEAYWELRIEPEADRGEAAYVEEFQALFGDAVRRRMVSDVPLGAFLSGGIDSSSIVAEMTRAGTGPVKTFTIGFADTGWRFDETDDSRLVARAFGADHHEWLLTEADVLSELPRLVDHFEQPCATGLPTYFVSQLARREVTVALAGIGGDELFAGYPRHQGMRLLGAYRRLPRFLREGIVRPSVSALPGAVQGVNLVRRAQLFVRSADRDDVGQYLAWSSAIAEEEVRVLLRPELASHATAARDLLLPYLAGLVGRPFRDQVLHLDIRTYLPFDLLELTDKLSMAHSLEVRVPYCDHRLVEFAARLPYRYKLRGLTGKYLPRRALRDRLPARVFRKPKQGFAVPMGLWIQGGLKETVQECLRPALLEERGLLRVEPVQRMLQEHLRGERDWTYRIWALVCLELWLRDSRRTGARECSSAS